MTTDTTTDTDISPIPTLRVRGPADLVQAVPYLLGFHPSRSLVLVGLRGKSLVVTARLDLADVAEPGLVPRSVAAMCRGGAKTFVAMIFDDDAMTEGHDACTPLPWSGAAVEVADTIAAAGADVDDVLLVSRRRMWSYTCLDPNCCPAQGRALPVASEVAAAATFAGLVALPDRDSLAASLRPEPDRTRLVPLIDAAEAAMITELLRGDDARATRSAKRAIFACARAADADAVRELPDEDVVRFAVALRRIAVRDSVWMAVDDRRLDGRSLWQQLARRLPPPHDAAALFLFAWRTWREGDGALAGIAAQRALDSDPGYSAADLLLAALSQAIDPRSMPRLRLAGR